MSEPLDTSDDSSASSSSEEEKLPLPAAARGPAPRRLPQTAPPVRRIPAGKHTLVIEGPVPPKDYREPCLSPSRHRSASPRSADTDPGKTSPGTGNIHSCNSNLHISGEEMPAVPQWSTADANQDPPDAVTQEDSKTRPSVQYLNKTTLKKEVAAALKNANLQGCKELPSP